MANEKDKKCSSLLRSLDVFGKKIELNYSGQQSFKTKYGAVTTTLPTIIMLGFTTLKLKKLFLREDSSQIENTVIMSSSLELNS